MAKGKCTKCGKSISYNVKYIGKKPYHQECKEQELNEKYRK